MKKTVLLDVDGVLADFIGSVLSVVASVTGREFTHDDVHEFDFSKALGLSPDESRAVKAHVSDAPGFWSGLQPTTGARAGVRALEEVAHVFIVTSPWNSCKTWLHDRESWLKKHFSIPHSHVIATSAKYLVAGDVFVDDKTDMVAKWEACRNYVHRADDGIERRVRAVQWQTPHNRRDVWDGLSTRSWAQLLEWSR